MLSNNTKATTFAKTDAKFVALVVNLSSQDNEKLLEPLKSGFKRTVEQI